MTYAGGFFLSSGLIAVAIAQNWYSRALSVTYFAGFAVFCTIASAYSFSKNPALFNRREVVFTALFLFLYALRVVKSALFSQGPLILPPRYYIYYLVAGCLVPMMAFFRGMEARTATAAYRSVVISAVVSMAACLWVYRSLLGTNFGRLGMSLEDALNPLQLAYLGSAVCVLAAYDILYRQSAAAHLSLRFLACVLAMGLAFLALIIGASKGALLSLAVCVLAAVVGRLMVKRYVASTVFILALLCLLPLLTNLTGVLGSGLVERLRDPTEYSGEGRMALVTATMSEFAASPLFGSGLELKSMSFPHNVIAEAFLTTGIFGGTLFVGLCIWATYRSMRILVYSPRDGWIGLLFIHYFVMAELSGVMYLAWPFWYSYAAVMWIRVAPVRRTVGSTVRADWTPRIMKGGTIPQLGMGLR
jgi:O-antigen ligase